MNQKAKNTPGCGAIILEEWTLWRSAGAIPNLDELYMKMSETCVSLVPVKVLMSTITLFF